ncbi:DUF2799 domain-containing protein [Vibrio sp. ZSDZ65]|uniref:DUF2799 domain-containing protein n=1 Tax=Vibrio qingdaonensis TaxID=2829491 RepID=A0A9X3CQG0_9VIBR|nr:DUF2799 domain-containing protein [Vibrio qingdaonensis]MCW8347852.1 DUF2799 domain-containing protein [Vibrio qingdaonensis]
MKAIITVLAGLLLFGCANGIEELAKQGSWNKIGYQDGVRGQLPRTYSALQELGPANHAEYERGYQIGVIEFCDADFAYQIGLSGQYYTGACEGLPDAQRFRMEWQRGWSEYSN